MRLIFLFVEYFHILPQHIVFLNIIFSLRCLLCDFEDVNIYQTYDPLTYTNSKG